MKLLKKVLAGAGIALTGVVSSAHAALPAAATAAFTEISAAGSDVLDATWPIVGAVVAGFTMLKLFKRGASKV